MARASGAERPQPPRDGDDRPVIVFGNLLSASLAAYWLAHDSDARVAAFTVDTAYLGGQQYEGLPLVPFESLEERYPPRDYRLLIPMGYHRINGLRRARFEAARRRGYSFASYISSRACVWPGLEVGDNVLVYENAVVQPFATVGDNCIIRSGANISHHCRVADHAFVSVGVNTGGECAIGEQAFVGVGAVLRDRIHVAERSFIAAGAVVVEHTQADGVYAGNPARRTGKNAADVS